MYQRSPKCAPRNFRVPLYINKGCASKSQMCVIFHESSVLFCVLEVQLKYAFYHTIIIL